MQVTLSATCEEVKVQNSFGEVENFTRLPSRLDFRESLLCNGVPQIRHE